jgi:3-oxoacyl-[acyl-carrier-protein] synthase-3
LITRYSFLFSEPLKIGNAYQEKQKLTGKSGSASVLPPIATTKRTGVRYTEANPEEPVNMPNAIIAGTGHYLPDKRLTNRELENWIFRSSKGEDYRVSSDEIQMRTGILQRHLAREDETTSDMAAEAAKRAISSSGLHPDDIDLVMVATSTPDYKIPKVAPLVAAKAGLHGVGAYDFGKDCTGFVEALEAASYFVQGGRYQHILVVGADKCSSFVNPKNKGTAVIFGDGAGAAVVSSTEQHGRGFLSAVAGSQGETFDRLYIPMGGSAMPFSRDLEEGKDRLVMDGKSVAGYASQVFAVGVERVLSQERMVAENLDLLIPHQANLRIIESGAKALDLPMSKVYLTIEKTGNTAAASVAIALDMANHDGKLKPGNLVAFIAYGAGLNWMAALFRW